MKHSLPCYSYTDTNDEVYFIYYPYKGDSLHLLRLRSDDNVLVAVFRVRKWKSNPNI